MWWRNPLIARVLWLLAAAGMTVLTLWFPVVVSTDPEHMESVRLGWPLWFAVQDQSRYTPPGEFWRTGLVSPWECRVRVVWWRFLASWAVVAGLLWLVLRAVVFLTGWRAGARRG